MKKGKKEGRSTVGRLFANWLPQEKREMVLVEMTLTLAFLALMVLILVLSSVISTSNRLQLENAVERQFNDVALALQQNKTSDLDILSNEKVKGVGVYNSSGALVMGWGNVYNMLPVASIAQEAAQNEGATIMNFDSGTDTMEYIRFLRVPLPVTSIELMSAGLWGATSMVDTSTIMFISFDGSDFIHQQRLVVFVSFIGFICVIVLYLFVMKINRQNRQYKEQMAKQNSLVSLGQAARTLTHEIKNPLSAITIQLALLKRQVKDEELQDELRLMESETQRLISLTNRVSDFLRNPEGQPEQIDLMELIRQLVPLFAYPITIVPSSVSQAYILFDPDRLRSVIENILKNGVESCEGRDPQVEVEVVLGRKGMYHVYVRDRGDGIQGDVEKLFDPFYTTKIHGSGIGLAISRQFLRARGGDIRIGPRPGGGTVVELTMAKYSFVQELVVAGPAGGRRRRRRRGESTHS